MPTWLVTGGAGYIGSHVVRALTDAGLEAVVYDDLSSGRRAFVPDGVPLVKASVLDQALLERTLRERAITGVIHLAGFKYAGVSVQRPLHTYAQNVDGTRAVLEAMEKATVTNLVFSSSAAVYGVPDTDSVTENTPQRPTSPYGESKLIGEWLIRDQAVATAGTDSPLRHTSLRYFNVVGSATSNIFDTSPHNLFPLVFEALLEGRTPRINGDDYNTPDGTNVRDYVHVADIAAAHVTAAQRLYAGDTLEPAYNLGSNRGLSVREIMTAIKGITRIDFTPEIAPRRAGDPDRIVATGALAARDLDWDNRFTIQETVRSGWEARRASAPATRG